MSDAPAGLGWLQLLLTGASVPGGVGIGLTIWRLWVWRFGSGHDKAMELEAATEQNLGKRNDARVESMFSMMQNTLTQRNVEIAELKEDRDRGWQLARHWYFAFASLVPQTRQAWAIASATSRRLLGAGLITEAEMPLLHALTLPDPIPDLEDPAPKKARTP